MITKRHKFHSKSPNDGSWMIWCPVTKGSFSTNLWKQGKVKRQICPCCGFYVNEDILIETIDEYQINKQELQQQKKYLRYNPQQRNQKLLSEWVEI